MCGRTHQLGALVARGHPRIQLAEHYEFPLTHGLSADIGFRAEKGKKMMQKTLCDCAQSASMLCAHLSCGVELGRYQHDGDRQNKPSARHNNTQQVNKCSTNRLTNLAQMLVFMVNL